MSVRTETLQLRVVIDGTPARKELATLDQEYAKLNAGLRDLKKGSEEAIAAQKRMSEITERQGELREEIGLTALTLKQLNDQYRQLQVARRNLTPGTEAFDENTRAVKANRDRVKELNDVNMQAAAAWEVQRRQIRLTDMTMEQLEQEAARLRLALHTMDPNTAIFQNTRRELQQVELRSKELGRSVQGVFHRARTELRAFAGSMLGIGAAVYGAVRSVQTFVRWNAELSDALADVRKTTGLSQEAVLRLSDALAGIDTRSSREELLALARDAGKLGITAEADLLKFVRAGDQIKVSLGEDLGDDAIKAIGKLNQTFRVGETTGKDLEQQMLSTGSAINELGQSSTASEAYLVDFTTRMAGVNTQAGINIKDTLGFAAALDQLGQRSETSSTALSQFTLKAFSDTGTYAKIAGMELGEFTKLLNTNANEALLRTLEGLNGNNEGLGRMTTLFADMGQEGTRAVSTLASLAKNTGLVREQQLLANSSFEEATSITEEFSTKNNTLAADLDKLGNAWKNFVTSVDQGSGPLSKALRGATASLTSWIDGLREAEGFQQGMNALFGGTAAMMDKANREVAKVKALLKDDPLGLKEGVSTTEELEKRLQKLLDLREAFIRAGKTEAAGERDGVISQLQAELELRREIAAASGPGEDGKVDGDDKPDAVVGGKKDDGMKAQLEQMRKDLEAHRERMFQDGLTSEERDLRQLDLKHAAELAKLRANALATEADLKALQDQQAGERANLIEAQGEERVKGYSEAAMLIRQATLDAETLELEAEIEKFQTLIDLGKKYNQDVSALEEAKEKALAAIREKWRLKRKKDLDDQKAEERAAIIKSMQEQITLLQSMGGMLNGLNSMMGAFYKQSEEQAYEHTAAARALAIIQMNIAAAVAIAEAVKSIMADPTAPFIVKLGYAAAAAGQVMSAIATARNLLSAGTQQSGTAATGPNSSGPSSMPTGARGGIGDGDSFRSAAKGGVFDGPSHSNGGLQVWNPQTGRQVAEVEGGEPWMVLSRAFRAKNAELIPLLMDASANGTRLPIARRGGIFGQVTPFNFSRAGEALRMASGGILEGSKAQAFAPSAKPNASSNAASEELLLELRGMNAKLAGVLEATTNWPTEVRAVASVQDLNRRQAELKDLQDRNRVSISTSDGLNGSFNFVEKS